MDEHGDPGPSPAGPSPAFVFVVVTLVAVADLVTGMVFTYSCRLGDLDSQPWIDFCDSPLTWLPPLGAGLTVAGGVHARMIERAWPLGVGAGLGLGIALGLWVLMGDPAGNFDGLLTA
jgi:hypothetical protein